MSAHVLLNLLNELGKRDKMRGLPSILSLFRNEFNKFNNHGLQSRPPSPKRAERKVRRRPFREAGSGQNNGTR